MQLGLRTMFVNASSNHQQDFEPSMRLVAPDYLCGRAAGLEDGPWLVELELRVHAHAGVGGAPADVSQMTPMLEADVAWSTAPTSVIPIWMPSPAPERVIVLTPSSEMASGLQPLQIQKLVDRGIRPGLGVDTERMAPGDLFAQMRAAISLHTRLSST